MGFRRQSTTGSAHQNYLEDFDDDPLIQQTLAFAAQNDIQLVPLDITSLAEQVNVTLKRPRDLGDKLGQIEIQGDSAEITLHKDLSENRKRFTLAHEIGHKLKHGSWHEGDITAEHVPQALTLNRSAKKGGLEAEVNRFAARLLVPRAKLVEYAEISSDDDYLADTFGVSRKVIEIRKQEVGIK